MALNQYSDNERLGLAANWTEEAASKLGDAINTGLFCGKRARWRGHVGCTLRRPQAYVRELGGYDVAISAVGRPDTARQAPSSGEIANDS